MSSPLLRFQREEKKRRSQKEYETCRGRSVVVLNCPTRRNLDEEIARAYAREKRKEKLEVEFDKYNDQIVLMRLALMRL